MKSIIAFFQIILLCISGFSQRNWSWYNPFPDGYHLNDIVFTSATNGWAVGDAGKLMHYNGQKWVVSEKYTNGGLRGLFFLDENHGWAVGGNRVILKYTDGLWSVNNPESNLHLYAVFFTSENNGWAVGEVRMHYTGNQWITIDTIGYSGITDLFFTDENNGWAGGSQKFYHYDTTGWHWYSLGFSDYYSVNAIFFLDSAQGWIGGRYGDDYKYIKKYSGTNWSMSSSPPIISNDLFFNTPSHGWSCGDIGYMQMTDSTIWEYTGGHWIGSYISYGIPNSLAVLDSTDLYVATEYGHILYHDSSGWNLSNSLSEGKTELSFPDTSHGWAVGEGKNILHFTHGNWTIDTSFKTTRFEHIHFSDSVHGIASGRLADTSGLYAIYQYSDGQWHFITDTIHIAIKSVFCFSNGNAWLSGTSAYGSNIIKLNNNILTYSSLTDYNKVISLSFTDQENGWAIGKTSNFESSILHYQGGQWISELTTSITYL